ncbi:hypothetical protein [Yinghuangia seranimata]|uniref:hypothetical protein n=1 Tax=Yinghuangia seranimata TaxID=408067 RepID=UPI00248CD2E6|nr:hypothetical protein [Yinghuangia seranimata]MDI2127593.1 hypothetical protein [Yinghuangia seranimata]
MTTDWRTRLEDALRECTAQSQLLGIQQTESADRRAAAIAAPPAVRRPHARHGRRGRPGHQTRAAAPHLRTARRRPRRPALRLDLAELPTQDPAVWQDLAALLSRVYFDAGWIAEPGRLIAAEAADAAGHGEGSPAWPWPRA